MGLTARIVLSALPRSGIGDELSGQAGRRARCARGDPHRYRSGRFRLSTYGTRRAADRP